MLHIYVLGTLALLFHLVLFFWLFFANLEHRCSVTLPELWPEAHAPEAAMGSHYNTTHQKTEFTMGVFND
jgi:hypothetical protein